MIALLLTALIIMLTLAAISYVTAQRSGRDDRPEPRLTLLPGDISYENKSGNVKIYFPITTSIVVSIVLTLLMRLLG